MHKKDGMVDEIEETRNNACLGFISAPSSHFGNGEKEGNENIGNACLEFISAPSSHFRKGEKEGNEDIS